jgi:ABC-2 type transport system permease protein
MLFQIIKYELRYWLTKPVVYFYFIAFFGFTLISFLGEGGYFNDTVSNSSGQEFLNSSASISTIIQYLGKLFLFLLPAIIGQSIYKDFKYKAHHIIYSFPIKKHSYLMGKFFSSLTVVLLISTSAALALFIGEYLLGIENPKITDFNCLAYVQAFGVFLIPNLVFFGVVVFAVVALTRNIYSGFVTVVLLFFVQLITENVFDDAYSIALSDPFGQNTLSYVLLDWSLLDRNTLSIPTAGIVFYNRLLWLLFSVVTSAVLYRLFSFSQQGPKIVFRKMKSTKTQLVASLRTGSGKISDVAFDFSLAQKLKTIAYMSWLNFKHCIGSTMFYVFSGLGLVAVVFMLINISQMGELAMQPMTRVMLSIPAYFFVSIIIIITFVYSGMLVHRDKTAKMDGLIHSTPVANSVLLLSKIFGLILVQYLLLTILLICGVVVQLSLGYYNLDLPQYFMNLYVVTGITLIVWTLVSVFLHSLLSNVYLGMFLLLFLWVLKSSVTHLGIDTQLLQFNTPPNVSYSDMFGYGSELSGYFLVEFYWFGFTSFLLFIAYLLWKREQSFTLAERIRIALKRFNLRNKGIASLLVLVTTILGIIIYKAEGTIHSGRTSSENLLHFTESFGHYAGMNQPRITSIQMSMDIHPYQHAFTANGTYTLLNTSDDAINVLLVKTGFDEETQISLGRENSLIQSDSNMRFYVYQLDSPLQANDSMTLEFEMRSMDNTLFEVNNNVLENGTFIKSDILPRLGYYIPSEKRQPEDSVALNNHYQAIDSDLIDFECVISTSSDQLAIATGHLVEKWQDKNRNFYRYRTEYPIKMGMAFNSGDYSVLNDRWNDTKIAAYYQKAHAIGAKRMLDGLKAALAYNSSYFDSYSYSDMNLVEFPNSIGSFATAFGNSLQVSELRFGVKPNENSIDLSFYVAAHEMTHHWFGNKLMPKDVLGATLLTESISEYITLNIYRNEIGAEGAIQFLKKQRQRYLRRNMNNTDESPLYLAKPEDEHLTYGKGTMAFNSLAHYWGEENLNHCLHEFMLEYSSDSLQYPTSRELLVHLKSNLPDSLLYVVKDMFETVRFHQNSIDTATLTSTKRGFDVEVKLNIKKMDATNAEWPLHDYLQVGVYDENGVLLELQQTQIFIGDEVLQFHLFEKPYKVVVDPNILTIEHNIKDNDFVFQ